mgnify:CR=1 FL=1
MNLLAIPKLSTASGWLATPSTKPKQKAFVMERVEDYAPSRNFAILLSFKRNKVINGFTSTTRTMILFKLEMDMETNSSARRISRVRTVQNGFFSKVSQKNRLDEKSSPLKYFSDSSTGWRRRAKFEFRKSRFLGFSSIIFLPHGAAELKFFPQTLRTLGQPKV